MQPKVIRLCVRLAGGLLFITGMAKIASAFGGMPVLKVDDPIFKIPFRYVFLIVGNLEVFIALMCFFNKQIWIRAGLIASIATNFLIYRFALFWIGWQKPCHCLGDLTGVLHISPEAADAVMKVVLAYLLIGSYASLFCLWRHRNISVNELAQQH